MYRRLKRARGRDMDIAIAACAVQQRARLWTLNPDDFRDLPAVELYEPPDKVWGAPGLIRTGAPASG